MFVSVGRAPQRGPHAPLKLSHIAHPLRRRFPLRQFSPQSIAKQKLIGQVFHNHRIVPKNRVVGQVDCFTELSRVGPDRGDTPRLCNFKLTHTKNRDEYRPD